MYNIGGISGIPKFFHENIWFKSYDDLKLSFPVNLLPACGLSSGSCGYYKHKGNNFFANLGYNRFKVKYIFENEIAYFNILEGGFRINKM